MREEEEKEERVWGVEGQGSVREEEEKEESVGGLKDMVGGAGKK